MINLELTQMSGAEMAKFSKIIPKTVPCKWCGKPTPMLGTRICDRCWELEHRIVMDIKLAKKMLSFLTKKKTKES